MIALTRIFILSLFCSILLFTPVSGQFFLYWDYFDYLTDTRESGNNPEMVIDNSGMIHISYWDEPADKLVYAFRANTSGTWTREYIDQGAINGHVSAIRLDSQGDVHIAYFQNENGFIRVKHAERSGAGSWTADTLPVNTQYGWGIGKYGPTVQESQAEFIKHSIDMVIDSADNPKISFFAPYYNTEFIAACGGYYRDYEFRLYNAYKLSGTWAIRSFQDYPDRFNNCFGAAPLPRGVRYGEFCSMVLDDQNQPRIFTNAFHNRELLRFDATDDSTWTMVQMDSALKVFDQAFLSICWSWVFPAYWTIESVSANKGDDGYMHVVFTTSINYGKKFMADLAKFYTVVYMQMDPTGAIVNRFQLFPEYPIINFNGAPCDSLPYKPYHAYSSVASRNADTVYMAFGNRDSSLLIFAESIDSGSTWALDTMMNVDVVTESPLQVAGDSVYLLVYDQSLDRLFLKMRHVGGGSWKTGEITYSQRRGMIMDANFMISGSDTVTHIAFADDFNDELFYGAGTLSGSIAWVTEQIDTGNFGFAAVKMKNRPSNGEPWILYTRGGSDELILAHKTAGNWVYEIIDDSSSSMSGDLDIGSDDTIRLVYSTNIQTESEHPIIYQAQKIGDLSWSREEIKNDWPVSDTVDYEGEAPHLATDSAGFVHVVFHDRRQRSVHYAKRTNGPGWQDHLIEFDSTASFGKFNSIAIAPGNIPMFTYSDDIKEHLKFAEPDTGDAWILSVADSSDVTGLGQPNEIVFGQSGEPWIAYNYYNGYNNVRLKFRSDSVWYSAALSTTGQVGGDFAFGTIGEDLFLAGRKNEPGNTGIALFRSRNALSIDREEFKGSDIPLSMIVYPNPVGDEATVEFELKSPSRVKVSILDMYGRELGIFSGDDIQYAGKHRMTIPATSLQAGFYFIQLEAGNGKLLRKIVILN